MKPSSIAWTDCSGGACNFIHGCTPASEGCAHCYARAMYKRFGLDFAPTFDADKLAQLATLRFPEYSPKRGAPHKPMAFISDTGDFFHESILICELYGVLDVLAERTNVIWQILTKRAERMNVAVCEWLYYKRMKRLPDHIWLGVTAENQRRADERIPALLATPAAVRFVSCEPMLEPMDLTGFVLCPNCAPPSHYEPALRYIDWVICGGESGPHRRPFDVAWALDLYAQCKSAGVPFFYKQSGALRPGQDDDLPGIGKVKEWPNGND